MGLSAVYRGFFVRVWTKVRPTYRCRAFATGSWVGGTNRKDNPIVGALTTIAAATCVLRLLRPLTL